ncbi:four helix bundle protein [Algoriphagus machipongonensis]|uniref:S23 ribosomal protein n=1 Tax=Algoriphagus machipongonensis TaxID=388413 RepID=A3I153_9BACT|nr:four helix bundle protein [Algoriphagus machipongonensis]EAZ80199.1 S23 ribosomal protein [Algoriphagus machipongonensis]
METKSKFIPVKELEIYQLSRRLSSKAWSIYQRLDYHLRKNWGDQMISSIDTVGANIAEGYARFHFLDRVKFYYIARASLSESVEHWIDLGFERKIVLEEEYSKIHFIAKRLH